VDFKYSEAGQEKRALVKARLCEQCAYKLHYRRLKAQRRRSAREAVKRERKGSKTGRDRGEVVEVDDDSDESGTAGAGREPRAPKAEGGAGGATEEEPTKDEKRLLESLAWRGPDPETRTRQDDFDDYLNDLFM